MKIFRKLIFEKLFALTNQEFLSIHSRLVLLNLLKCFELFNLDGGVHVNHWVNKAVNSTLLIQRKFKLPQEILSILDRNSNTLSLSERYKLFDEAGGSSEKDIISGCLVKDFLNIGSSKETGQEANYGHLYKEKQKIDSLIKRSVNKYLIYFKYITLCLSGQLEPSDWWLERGNIPKMKIDYNKVRNLSTDEIKNIISICILNICGENNYFNWGLIS